MSNAADNPRVIIGGNSAGLDEAIARFDLVGYLLVRHETLMRAAMDDRIDRACLKVLGMLIATMNRETRTSWAGREYISECIGLTPKSISNYIYQLKGLGYIVAERRQTPQANNRVLMHYTLSKLSPEEIETAIETAISSIKGERNAVVKFPSQRELKTESSRQDRNSPQTVPVLAGTKVPVPAGTHETSRSDGNEIARPDRNSGPKTAESSRQDGHSIKDSLSTTKNRTSGEKTARGTRLDPTRDLAKECGTWAMENFEISRQQAYSEWQGFCDYWTSQPGTRGTKLNWPATWRNWMRNSKNKYRLKQGSDAGLFGKPTVATKTDEQRKREEDQLAAEGWEIARGDP